MIKLTLIQKAILFTAILVTGVWTFNKVNSTRYATQEILKGYTPPSILGNDDKSVIPAPTTSQAATPVLPPVTPGTNPPHGQPGHRCDIPVGASLSAPAKGEPNSMLNTNSQVRLNPAHGQPGHRCDIPVGQALP